MAVEVTQYEKFRVGRVLETDKIETMREMNFPICCVI